MTGVHLGITTLSIILAVVGGLLYGAVVLYGAWIDGRRQALRNKGLHPVTEPTGEVHAGEGEQDNGGQRD